MCKKLACIVLLLFIGSELLALEYDSDSRTGEMPAYRYYDRFSSAYSDSSYKPEDLNTYWGERYYNNHEPDPRESLEMKLKIMKLES